MMAILGIGVDETLQRLNATKNVLAALVNGVSGVLFVAGRRRRLADRRADRRRRGRRRPDRRDGRSPAAARRCCAGSSSWWAWPPSWPSWSDGPRSVSCSDVGAQPACRCSVVDPRADLRPGQHDVVPGAVDGDAGDVAAEATRPTAGSAGRRARCRWCARRRPSRRGHACAPTTAPGRARRCRGRGAARRGRGGSRAASRRTPGRTRCGFQSRLKSNSPLVVAVQGLGVDAVDRAGDQPARLPGADLVERHPGGGVAQPRGALHVEPRGVEHQPGQLGRAAVVEPQRQGQPAGGVGGRHDRGVPSRR